MPKQLPDIAKGKKIIFYRNKKKLSWGEIGKVIGMDRHNAKRTYKRVVRLSTDIKKAHGIKGV